MSTCLTFTRMHGAGNDFVVLTELPDDPAAMARRLCRRRSGVGGDGLLIVTQEGGDQVRMRMFNPDGTEDDCGNGLRCVAHLAWLRGLAAQPEFDIRSLTGVRRVRVEPSRSETDAEVTVQWGRAKLRPEEIPVHVEGDDALDIEIKTGTEVIHAASLFTGSAHTVILEAPDDERFQRLSPLIEHHPLFPERTSVMWTSVEGPNRIRVRIWERGAGETLACGTGACAAAVVTALRGVTGPEVTVASRGGELHVRVGEHLDLEIRGPSQVLLAGRIELD